MTGVPQKLLIQGGLLLDGTSTDGRPREADILIEGSHIAAVVPRVQGEDGLLAGCGAVTVVDASNRLVTPGFFNAHYHSHDVLLKGWFEPLPLEIWLLNAIPHRYGPRSLEEIRVRSLLGALECIRGGITTIQDMVMLYPLDPARVEAMISAYEELGIRVVLGLQVANVPPLDTVPYWRECIPADCLGLLQPYRVDTPTLRDPVDVIEEFYLRRDQYTDLVRWAIAPSSPERCTPELLKRLSALAERYSLPVYSHVYISRAEKLNAGASFQAYGGSLIRFLDRLGLLNDRLSLAHAVWLDGNEVRQLAQAGVSVILNTISNLKNKNGVAPIRELFEAGINLALGCDNCSCTDAQNIFQAMKMTCLLAAISDPCPGRPDAMDAFRAATVGGARTAGLQDELGLISVGMRADLVLFDLGDPALIPLNNAARQLVYSECGRSVDTVIVNGRLIMEKKEIRTISEAKLRKEMDSVMESFRPEAERVIASTSKLRPFLLEADRRMWTHELDVHRYIGGYRRIPN